MKLDWKTCFRIGISIFLLYLCIRYWKLAEKLLGLLISAAVPLIIGAVIAYVVNILMSWYERHFFPNTQKVWLARSRRPVCMLGAFVSLLVVVCLVFVLIVPQLTSCVQIILAELPGVFRKAVALADQLGVLPENIMDALENIDWRSRLGQIIQVVTSGIGSVVDVMVTTVSSVFSVAVTALLSVIFSIYLLSSKETLSRQYHRFTGHYLKKRWCEKLEYILHTLDDCFHRYIVGQCLEAVILGLLCTLGMLLFKLPYATMIGALVAFTALIPVAGAYIGAFVGAFMILTVSPVKALGFLVFLVILQQLEGNLIYPKVVGSSMGLPGIWVLAAVTVGGGMMGIAGMLLGVPLAAAIYRFVREDIRKPEAASKDDGVLWVEEAEK